MNLLFCWEILHIVKIEALKKTIREIVERTISYSNVQLKAGNLISYTGKSDIGQYYFRKIKFCEVDKNGRRGLFIDLIFSRPLTGSFMTIFLPTGMLLMISQMSTIFSYSFLDMVIEVNTTLLLVLTT